MPEHLNTQTPEHPRPDECINSVRDLTHRYGERTVLNRVNLQIRPGEFFAFLGQNGAGKSTAIRTMCGFLTPTEGEIRVAGVNVVKNPAAVRRHIGVLSEDVELYDRLTGAEFLEFAGQMHGLAAAEARDRKST